MSRTYLMRAQADNLRFNRWAAERRLNDPDLALHCLVYETFGREAAPTPFRWQEQGTPGLAQRANLLAYTNLTAEELRDAVARTQKKPLARIIAADDIATVATPDPWEAGTMLRFEVRVRPTRRQALGKGPEERMTERDRFLGAPEGSTRAQVYCDWVAEQIQREGAARVMPGSMAMTRLAIRSGSRKTRQRPRFTGPDANIQGIMAVQKPEEFRDLLARGIGRHRSYGYGMLIVRRA